MTDALAAAAAALRAAPVPPPPAGLAAAVTARLTAEPARPVARRRFMRYARYGAATAAAVALAAGLFWAGGSSAEARLRRALDNAAKAKSVRLVFTREYEGKSEPCIAIHIRDGKSRWDDRRRGKEQTILVDTAAPVVLELDHKARTARRTALDADTLRVAAKQHEVFFDPLKVLRETKEMTVKQLDGEKLGGRAVRVYLLSHPGNQEHAAMTGILWVDEQTALPARLKLLEDGIVTEGREKPYPKADTVIAFEDWDKAFDPALFSPDVPAGYRVEDAPAPAAELPVALFRRAADKAAAATSYRVVIRQRGRTETVYVGKDAVRAEMPADHAVVVLDLARGVEFQLNSADKTATRTTLSAGEVKAHREELASPTRLLAYFRGQEGMTVRERDRENVGGREVRVYSLTRPAEAGKPAREVVLWVDAKTDLPARFQTPGADGRPEVTAEFDRWNETFDPVLFRTDVPPGYTLTDPNP